MRFAKRGRQEIGWGTRGQQRFVLASYGQPAWSLDRLSSHAWSEAVQQNPESFSSPESHSLPLGLADASPPTPVFSLTSSVTHITPCCRWGGSLALGIHTAYVCVSRQWKRLLTEDEAVSPSFFAQGAVSQTLKLNIFSPFTNGMKQIP